MRVRIVGADNLPAKGPFVIMAGSHTTELESLLISAYFPQHQVHFFAKAELWRYPPVAWVMDRTGQIPVARHDNRTAIGSLSKGVELLRNGGVLAVFPEGTFSRDQRVHRGRTGAMRVAIDANVPVVPMALKDMKSLVSLRRLFGRSSAQIVIGQPIVPQSLYTDTRLSGVKARLLTDIVMREIARLAETEYVNEYLAIPARRRKKR